MEEGTWPRPSSPATAALRDRREDPSALRTLDPDRSRRAYGAARRALHRRGESRCARAEDRACARPPSLPPPRSNGRGGSRVRPPDRPGHAVVTVFAGRGLRRGHRLLRPGGLFLADDPREFLEVGEIQHDGIERDDNRRSRGRRNADGPMAPPWSGTRRGRGRGGRDDDRPRKGSWPRSRSPAASARKPGARRPRAGGPEPETASPFGMARRGARPRARGTPAPRRSPGRPNPRRNPASRTARGVGFRSLRVRRRAVVRPSPWGSAPTRAPRRLPGRRGRARGDGLSGGPAGGADRSGFRRTGAIEPVAP